MIKSTDEPLRLKSTHLLLFRLYTRGMTVREDYEWRREFGEGLTSEESKTVECMFKLLNLQRGRTFKRWAIWRAGERLHILHFDVPSARRDHVNRPIVSHIHYVLESASLSAQSTLSELTRYGLGAALLALTQVHSIQDPPKAFIELLDKLMISSKFLRSLEELTPQFLKGLASLFEHQEESLDDTSKVVLQDAHEMEAGPIFPSFIPTPKGIRELRRLETSSLANKWRDEHRRCVLMSEVSEQSVVDQSERLIWWLMTKRQGGCLVCDELSPNILEDLTSLTKSPWWILTHKAGDVETQDPTLVWREPLLSSILRRFMGEG